MKLKNVFVIVDERNEHIDIFPEPTSVSPWNEDAVEAATVTLSEGQVSIRGKRRTYRFNTGALGVEGVDERYLVSVRQFPFFGKKVLVPKDGWVLMKAREEYSKTFIGYATMIEMVERARG